MELPHHRFLSKMLEQDDYLHRLAAAAFTTNLLEVFVDDFCALINNLSKEHLTKFSKALIHGIHSVFPPTRNYRTSWGRPNFTEKDARGRRDLGNYKRIVRLDC